MDFRIIVNKIPALRRKVCIKKKNSVNILVNISQKLTKSFYEQFYKKLPENTRV